MLTLGSGLSNVTVTNAAAVNLTIGSLARTSQAGGTVNFSPSISTITLTTPGTITNGILGGYATFGATDNSGNLDFATVDSNKKVTFLGSGGPGVGNYNTTAYATTAWAPADNIQSAVTNTLPNSTVTINSLYMTGAGVITFAGTSGKLVVGTGGIITNGATMSQGVSNNVDLTNTAVIGGTVAAAGPGVTGGQLTQSQFPGTITSSNGELLVATSSNIRINCTIADNGSSVGLTKSGSGILDLSNGNSQGTKSSNSYTGRTVVNGGILAINQENQLGTNSSAKTDQLVLNGGELKTFATLNPFSANRGITVGPQGGTFSYQGGNTTVFDPPITGAGGGMKFEAIGFANYDEIDLNPASAYTYSGPTTFAACGLLAGGYNSIALRNATNNVLPSNTALTVTGAQGANPSFTYGFFDLYSKSITIGSLAGDGRIICSNSGSSTITLGGNNQSTNYSGQIGETGFTVRNGSNTQTTNISIVKNGTGVFTLSNPTGLVNTGTTTINNGGLSVTNTSGSGTGSGIVIVNGSSTTTGVLGGNGTISGAVTVNSGGHIAPTIVGTGTSSLKLAGGLSLANGTQSGSTYINVASLDFNLSINTANSDNIVVTGAVTGGTGLTVNVTNLGAMAVGNIYHLVSATTVPSTITGYTVNGPKNFLYSLTTNTTSTPQTIDLNVLDNPNPLLTWFGAPGNGTWDTVTTNTPWLIFGGGTGSYTDGALLTFDSTPGTNSIITLNSSVAPSSMTISNNALANYTINGSGSITGSVGFSKAGLGSFTFNTANTFTGTASITGGSLIVGAPGSLADSTYLIGANGTLTVNGQLTGTPTVTNSGTLAVASTGSISAAGNLGNTGTATLNNAAQSLATIGGSGGLVLNGTALTLTSSCQYDGIISGTGTVTVSGSSLTLTNGGNTYAGTTVNSNAVLVLGNTSGSATGTAAVAVNGVLAGTGFSTGAVALNLGSHLAPGAPGTGNVGTLNLGPLTSTGGASLDFDCAAPGTNDQVLVTGALNFSAVNGATIVNINPLAGFGVGTYTLLTATGTFSDTAQFTVVPNTAGPGYLSSYAYTVTNSGNSIILTVSINVLVWTGATSNSWDFTSANWAGGNNLYVDGTQAKFTDNAGTNNNITIPGIVTPASGLLFTNTTATPYSFSGTGPIAGPGPLTLSGTGSVTFTTLANTYVGSTILNAGTLNISQDSNLGTPPSAATPGSLQLLGGTLDANTSFALNANRGISVGTGTAAGTIGVVGSGTILTYGGIVADATATGVLNKTGIGELDLSAANTFSGGLNINAGMARLTNVTAAGTGTITVNPGGVLHYDAAVTNAITLAGGTMEPLAAQTLSGGLTVTAPSTIYTYDNFISGTAELDIILTGTLHGAGNINVSTFSTNTGPDGSGLRLRGAVSTDYTGTITVGPSTKFEIQIPGTTGSPAGTGTIVLTGGTMTGNTGTFSLINLRNNGGASTTLGNNFQMTSTGTALLNLLAGVANDTITLGTLLIGTNQTLAASATSGANIQTAAFGATTLAGNATFQPGIPGNGTYVVADNILLGPVGESTVQSNLTANGTATLTLSANNTYTGTTTVASGTLQLGTGGTVGNISSAALNFGPNATLLVNRSDSPTYANAINLTGTASGIANAAFFSVINSATLSGGSITSSGEEFWKAGAGTLTVSEPANSFVSNVVVQAGVLQTDTLSNAGSASSLGTGGIFIGQSGSGTLRYTGATAATDRLVAGSLQGSGSNATIDIANATTVLTVSSPIGDSPSPNGFTKAGLGTLTLTGANTYKGATVVSAGTLSINANNNLGDSATGAGVMLGVATLQSTGTFATPRVLTLTGNGTVDVTSGNKLTLLSPTAASANSLTKTSGGALVLTGPQGYAGGTVVNGGILSGQASGLGAIAVNNNSILFPGNVPTAANDIGSNQILSGSSVSFSGASKLEILVSTDGSSVHASQVSVTGAATVSATTSLSFGIMSATYPVGDAIILSSSTASIANPFVLSGQPLPSALSVHYYSGGLLGTDIGTPTAGTMADTVVLHSAGGAVTPVTIDAFTAKSEGAGVLVSWNSVSEFQNAGFEIFRRPVNGEWIKINPALIAGRITNPDAKLYRFFDWAQPGVYEYRLDSIGINGKRETYGERTPPVSVDDSSADAAVSVDALDAGIATTTQALSVAKARNLSAIFDASENMGDATVRDLSHIVSQPINFFTNDPATVSNVSSTHGNRLSAPPPASPIAMGTRSAALSPAVSARWFAGSAPTTASTYTAAKVRYNQAGVLSIPQTALPAGFNIRHLAVQREGRALVPLALTADALIVYGEGYADDYTNKDALFLRNTDAPTAAGQIAHAQGLFDGTQQVNVESPASVTAAYHDVYFDYTLRPYNYAPWFSSQYLTDGTDQSFSVNAPGASSGAASLTVNLWSLTQSDTVQPDHALQVLVNGVAVGQAQWAGGGTMMQLTFQIPSGTMLVCGKSNRSGHARHRRCLEPDFVPAFDVVQLHANPERFAAHYHYQHKRGIRPV